MAALRWVGVALVALTGLLAGAALAGERVLTAEERQELGRKVRKLYAEGSALHQAGRDEEAARRWLDVLELERLLYPSSSHPNGHAALAATHHALGVALRRAGRPGPSLEHARQALAMRRKLHPDGHPDLSASLINAGNALNDLGRREESLDHYQQALALDRRLYPERSFPNGHERLAMTLNNVGSAHFDLGRPEQAAPHFEEALAMFRKLFPKARFPDGHDHIARALTNAVTALEALGQTARVLAYAEEALAMRRRLHPKDRFPNGHPGIVSSLNSVGSAQRQLGRVEPGLGHLQEALAMSWKLYPQQHFPLGHAGIARSLSNIGHALGHLGQHVEALEHHRQALDMRRRLSLKDRGPGAYADLARSLTNVGTVLRVLGRAEDALEYFEQGLAMRRQLYPKERFPRGHQDLVHSLNNMATALSDLGRDEKVRDRCQEALTMCRGLYPEKHFPDGHDGLAFSLDNLGAALYDLGQFGQAREHYEEAVAMYRKLYPKERFPDGHPELARTLNNLAGALRTLGHPGPARERFEEALATWRKLYPPSRFPNGHSALAMSMTNGGNVLAALDRPEEALGHYREALAMQRRLLVGLSADAGAVADSFPTTRGHALSLLRRVPSQTSRAYAALAGSRGMLLQALALRQASTRAAAGASPEARVLLRQLTETNRQLGALLIDRAPAAGHEARIAALARERDDLQRRLGKLLPRLDASRLEEFDADELCRLLPAGSAFLDLVRFVDYPPAGEKEARRTVRYAAFALAAGQRAAFVDLGEAKVIDRAVHAWRQAILSDAGSDREAGQEVARLVWHPLRDRLPARLKCVSAAPDGALALLPWAALPTGKGEQVLLEECAVALVPHAYFLFDRLASPANARRKGTFLAVGDVHYRPAVLDLPPGPGKGHLPGTARELVLLRQLAFEEHRVEALDRGTATVARVTEALGRATVAHLATHGFYDGTRFEEEERRRLRWRAGREAGAARVGAGRDSPLAYVGMLLAGAEVPEHAGPGGGRLTGATVADLPLDNLQLAVLSACETGVGNSVRHGEGVMGLQHAFLLAGCRDVVSSLWKVDDDATCALMGLFYRNLWKEGLPPLEALRQAQLYLLRHPAALPLLAKRRGDSFLVEPLPPVKPAVAGARRASPYLWAGFALSGLGR